jgi:hypothetical protein
MKRLSLGLLMTILVAGAIAPVMMQQNAFATIDTPTTINGIDIDFDDLIVYWTDPSLSGGETLTDIDIDVDDTDATFGSVIESTTGVAGGTETHTFASAGLVGGETYYVRVTANTNLGTSVDSSFSFTVPISLVSGFSATPTANGGMDLAWTIGTGTVGTSIFAEDVDGSDYEIVFDTDATSMSFPYTNGDSTDEVAIYEDDIPFVGTITLVDGDLIDIFADGVIDDSFYQAGTDASDSQSFDYGQEVSVTADATAPTVTVNIVDASLDDTDNTSSVTFDFSEDTTDFVEGDLTVVGGTISAFAGTDDTYTATFTADDDTLTTGSVTVDDLSYTDAVGNQGAEGSDTVAIDTTNPTVTITASSAKFASITSGDTIADTTVTFSVTFSESVTGFDPTTSDIVKSGTGTVGAGSGSGAGPYTFDVTGMDGSFDINVAADAADGSGNGNVASSVFNVIVQVPSGDDDPIINLIGDNPQTIAHNGASYVSQELGATIYDVQDGSGAFDNIPTGMTAIINSTLVDVSTIGSYIVTYNATDSDDNIVLAERTVVVDDGSGPVISGVSNISIAHNAIFTPVTATCTDTLDGNILDGDNGSILVNPTGTVGTDPGDYEVTYYCEDSNGLFDEVTITVTRLQSGGGSGDDAHKTRPTFGLDWNTNSQIVEDGITFNKNSYDVTDNFHTDFARQPVMVGVNNVVAMKVYAQYDLKWVEFMFDVPETGKAHETRASIEVPMTWMDTDEIDQNNVKVVQDVNLINEDKVEVYRTPVTCASDDVVENCDLIAVKFPFNEQPASGVFAFKAVDERNRSTTTYFNEGIEVTGDSLNPLETVLVASPDRDHRGLVTLTQVGDRYDNLWSSEDGYLYTMNDVGTFLLVEAPESEVRVDSGSPDTRMHSAFSSLVEYEAAKAKYYYFNSEDIVSDTTPSFSYEFPEEDSRTQFLKQHSMLEFARGN